MLPSITPEALASASSGWVATRRAPEGAQTGWPALQSGGVPARRCTRQARRSSTKMAGARFPVYSSPQSSCCTQSLTLYI